MWQLMVDLVILDGLWKPHQRSHLPVKNVHSPPNLATSPDGLLSKSLDGHMGMHTLSKCNSQSLANLYLVRQMAASHIQMDGHT